MFSKATRVNLRWLGIYYAALLTWLATTAMHIPDGYLSPLTCFIMFLLVLPFWVIGVRKIRQSMNARSVPLIALLAAFSFVIMMFNIPVPGGTTAHAIGASLAAIILGPEIATIVVSIALIIQAFFFGDGGITALGANCFNMAVVVPYIAYAIYRAFSRDQPLNSARRPVGAALGGWTGMTVAAFFAGVEFGIQPLFFPVRALSAGGGDPRDGDPARLDRIDRRGHSHRAGTGLSTTLQQRHAGSRRQTGADKGNRRASETAPALDRAGGADSGFAAGAAGTGNGLG